MQDQLIVFMALARGTSRMLCGAPTLHTRTAIAVAQQLTGAEFHVQERGNNLWLLVCAGAAVACGSTAASATIDSLHGQVADT
jgi:RNA 3'-terminal phosphate cyclase (ATP)